MWIVKQYWRWEEWNYCTLHWFPSEELARNKLNNLFQVLLDKEDDSDLDTKERFTLINSEVNCQRSSEDGMLSIVYYPWEYYEIIDMNYDVDEFCEIEFLSLD